MQRVEKLGFAILIIAFAVRRSTAVWRGEAFHQMTIFQILLSVFEYNIAFVVFEIKCDDMYIRSKT